MANHPNHQELTQQAITSLAQGRAEISAEVHRLRHQLSPTRVAHRVVDQHTGLVISLAFIAGLIPALIIFRKKSPHEIGRNPVMTTYTKPPKPLLNTLLAGAFGILVKTITPALIKSTIFPQVLNSLLKKQPVVAGDSRPPSIRR